MIRPILGTLIGLITAVAAIGLVQLISTSFYPMPEGMKLEDTEAIAAWAKTLPVGALLFVLGSYILGSFVGGFTSTYVAKAYPSPAIIVSGILTVFGILNAVGMQHTIWFSVLIAVCFLPSTLFGARLARKPSIKPRP